MNNSPYDLKWPTTSITYKITLKTPNNAFKNVNQFKKTLVNAEVIVSEAGKDNSMIII
jgi:hypothetical protein